MNDARPVDASRKKPDNGLKWGFNPGTMHDNIVRNTNEGSVMKRPGPEHQISRSCKAVAR